MIIECICPTSNYYGDFERHSLSGHKKLVNNRFFIQMSFEIRDIRATMV